MCSVNNGRYVKIAYVFDLDLFKNINATHLICKPCVVIMCVKHVLHTKIMIQIRFNDLFMMFFFVLLNFGPTYGLLISRSKVDP